MKTLPAARGRLEMFVLHEKLTLSRRKVLRYVIENLPLAFVASKDTFRLYSHC